MAEIGSKVVARVGTKGGLNPEGIAEAASQKRYSQKCSGLERSERKRTMDMEMALKKSFEAFARPNLKPQLHR